jgi:hypothetical protein
MDIKKIFGNSVLTSSELVKKSSEAISVFHKVMSDLKGINEKSLSKQKELKDAALEIDREIGELVVVNTTNLKIISNIEYILK